MRALATSERIDEFFRALGRRQLDVDLEAVHDKDLPDARGLTALGLIEGGRLRDLFEAIEPQLYRYPAIDPAAFRRAVEAFGASR